MMRLCGGYSKRYRERVGVAEQTAAGGVELERDLPSLAGCEGNAGSADVKLSDPHFSVIVHRPAPDLHETTRLGAVGFLLLAVPPGTNGVLVTVTLPAQFAAISRQANA
jgi:hypothetical protein